MVEVSHGVMRKTEEAFRNMFDIGNDTRRSLMNQNPLEFLMQSMPEEAERSLLTKGSCVYPSLMAVMMLVSRSSLEEEEREGEVEKMEDMDCKVSGRRERASVTQLFSPGI